MDDAPIRGGPPHPFSAERGDERGKAGIRHERARAQAPFDVACVCAPRESQVSLGVDKIALPDQLAKQIGQREHVSNQYAFDPNARAWDEDMLPANFRKRPVRQPSYEDELPANFREPNLDE